MKLNKIHPGYYIKEIIQDEGLSIEDFATKTKIDKETIYQLINYSTDVDYNIAIKLANTYKTSVDVWLNLQNSYNIGGKNGLLFNKRRRIKKNKRKNWFKYR